MRLALRTRLALLTAMLVLVIAAGVGAAAYVSFRDSVLGRAATSARSEALRLRSLVSGGAGQVVDVTDISLSRQLAAPGVVVEVARPSGRILQSTMPRVHGRPAGMSGTFRRRCLQLGVAQSRSLVPPMSLACVSIGSPGGATAVIAVGVPLTESLESLSTLRQTLVIGVIAGIAVAAVLSLLVARRALRPVGRIAATAETIRRGDLSQRIGYGGHDELGQLAEVLDACFAELEDAVNRQRRFAADASHELRTPLAAIRANLELLRGWAASDPAAREAALEALDLASRRASRLVSDLLALVRIEREAQQVRAQVPLDELVVGAVREASSLRPLVPVRVSELSDVILPAGDPMGLHQVLVNVIENALDVSADGDEVTVGLAVRGDTASVTVSDRGPGIDPSELERIFDRFYSRKLLDRSHRGAGLGLAIGRTIAREHGGDLVARNNAGPGASFVLSLPTRQSVPGRAAAPTGGERAGGSSTTQQQIGEPARHGAEIRSA